MARIFRNAHLHRSLSFILVALLASTAFIGVVQDPSVAYAEVRTSDVLYGETIDSRGMSTSDCPDIDAQYAIVIDSEGTVYFERDADVVTQIASLTKVMTAIVALDAVESGIVSLDSIVTVSSYAASVGESSANLQTGDSMSLEVALAALLIPSGNDAAVAIAETIGEAYLAYDSSLGDSGYDVFIQLMNETALSLGCADTLFENPHGLDSETYDGDAHSTASDVAIIVQYAMQYEVFRDIVDSGDTIVTVDRYGYETEVYLTATDSFFSYSEYAIGVKTGYTDKAGYSFAGATTDESLELYVIVLGGSSSAERFEDAATLTDWVYENILTYQLINSTEVSSIDSETYPVVAKVAHSDWIDKTISATISDPDASLDIFIINGNVSQSVEFYEVTGDVEEGDVIGSISFKQRNIVLATYDLIACEDVAAPNFFESVVIWVQRLFAYFTGAQTVADSVVVNVMSLVVDKTTSS